MGISNRMDKVSWFPSRDMSHHVRQESVGGNVEGDTQSHVSAALVHLTGKFILLRVNLKSQEEFEKTKIKRVSTRFVHAIPMTLSFAIFLFLQQQHLHKTDKTYDRAARP